MDNDFYDEWDEFETREVRRDLLLPEGAGQEPLAQDPEDIDDRVQTANFDGDHLRSDGDGSEPPKSGGHDSDDPEDFISTRRVCVDHLRSLARAAQAGSKTPTSVVVSEPNSFVSTTESEGDAWRAPARETPPAQNDPEDYISTRKVGSNHLRSLVAELSPAEPSARLRRVVACTNAGNYRQALALARTHDDAFASKPITQRLQWWLYCGVLAIRARNFEAAEEFLFAYRQKAREVLGPWHRSIADCERYLGVLYRLTGRFEQALTAFSVSLRLCQGARHDSDASPTSKLAVASVLCSLGHLERHRGNLGDAVRHFARARERYDGVSGAGLHPGLASTLYGLGSTLLGLGDVSAGMFALARAYRIRTCTHATPLQRASVTLLYGHALWQAGQHERAYRLVEDGYVTYLAHPEAEEARVAVFRDWLAEHRVAPRWSAAS